MTSRFAGFDARELRLMQRVFREAKFCIAADDEEVSDSPWVAALFEELLEQLIAADGATNGNAARRWADWRAIDETRDEWRVAIQRVRNSKRWSMLVTEPERIEYVETLLRPFTVTHEKRQLFLATVENNQT